MSKINTRLVSGDGQTRIVEIDRRAPSLAHVQQQATRKFKSNVQQLVYQLPNGSRIALNNDNDLRRAISESVAARHHDVRIEVQVAGGRAVGAATTTAAAQPVHTPAPAAHHTPAQQPAPVAAPAGMSCFVKRPDSKASGSAVISFTVAGHPGGADKVKVAAAQQADSYHFIPEAAALDTLVEVELPNSKALVFKLTSASGKISQTFNMPFDVAPKDLSLSGGSVILKFPWM